MRREQKCLKDLKNDDWRSWCRKIQKNKIRILKKVDQIDKCLEIAGHKFKSIFQAQTEMYIMRKIPFRLNYLQPNLAMTLEISQMPLNNSTYCNLIDSSNRFNSELK